MFTGIVLAVGEVASIERHGDGARLQIRCSGLDLTDAVLGDSIAVNGVCLTVTELTPGGFAADLSSETLARTTLGRLQSAGRVNLEKALRLGDRLGGHLVTGHVDGVGTVIGAERESGGVRLRVGAPTELMRYIAGKGSVCVDGVSLTVNDVVGEEFGLTLIPHTLAVTTLGEWGVGRQINIEIDLVARYLERLILR